MVKVSAPLFSLDAQGSLGDSLVYKKKNDKNFVSVKTWIPGICIELRRPEQNYHSHTVETWHEVSDYCRADWGRWAEWNMPFWSGFNAFYHYYMVALNLHQIPSIWPPA